MEFDSETAKPTYRLITGLPGRSRAIEIARMIGLPSDVIDRAKERLGERYGETDVLLSTLQRRVAEVAAQQEELEQLKRESDERNEALKRTTAALEKERQRLGAVYREELERLRDDVTRQLNNEIRNLREMDKAARASLQPAEVMKTVTSPVERAAAFLPAEEREVRVGERAEHRKFKVVGDVVSIEGSRVVMNVNGRRMTVALSDLSPIAGQASPKKKTRERIAATSEDVAQISAELNLVGQRVDDALDESDRFLDRALLEGKQAVRIIHGFGTGTLRRAIRDHLRKHPAVRSWRPGADNEGGDGATIAVLEG
jgi:DNA mismatch repair protein MutS2